MTTSANDTRIQPDSTTAAPGEATADAAQQPASINGRCAFAVETGSVGVVVSTVFAATDGRLMPMPAVFPSLAYALEQIDTLRNLVIERFAQAAQVGAQVIALQRAQAADAARSAAAAGEPHDTAELQAEAA